MVDAFYYGSFVIAKIDSWLKILEKLDITGLRYLANVWMFMQVFNTGFKHTYF